MIHPSLHKNPVALDRDQHRTLRVRQDFADVSHTTGLNSMFLTAVEFSDACKEYPIVFVRAGTDPQTQKPDIAPVAVIGAEVSQSPLSPFRRLNSAAQFSAERSISMFSANTPGSASIRPAAHNRCATA